jgi:hypothetical protein
MTKVNIALLRQLKIIAHEALIIHSEATCLLVEQGSFCDECGETKPKSGFYPLIACGPGSVSGLICNDCDREIRARIEREKRDD